MLVRLGSMPHRMPNSSHVGSWHSHVKVFCNISLACKFAAICLHNTVKKLLGNIGLTCCIILLVALVVGPRGGGRAHCIPNSSHVGGRHNHAKAFCSISLAHNYAPVSEFTEQLQQLSGNIGLTCYIIALLVALEKGRIEFVKCRESAHLCVGGNYTIAFFSFLRQCHFSNISSAASLQRQQN